ncbi:MAG TPA: hypothetical protein VLA12_07975 [Planctomycetaceae bacterium]|nr:hypothetical protein [Planctomycetaceae bacterium]
MSSHTRLSRQLRMFLLCVGLIALHLGCSRLGFKVAEQIVLRAEYGSDTLHAEDLRIVSVKPTLQVSNGDRLEEWSFTAYLISAGVWVVSLFGLGAMIWRVLPAEYRDIVESGSTEPEANDGSSTADDSHGLSLLVVILIFITLFASCIGSIWISHLFFS